MSTMPTLTSPLKKAALAVALGSLLLCAAAHAGPFFEKPPVLSEPEESLAPVNLHGLSTGQSYLLADDDDDDRRERRRRYHRGDDDWDDDDDDDWDDDDDDWDDDDDDDDDWDDDDDDWDD